MTDERDAVTISGTDDGHEEGGVRRRSRRKRDQRPFWQELPLLVVTAAVIAALVVNFLGRPYVIPSQSMEPTLHGCAGCTGDRIYVERLSYDFGSPQQGDVVVFKAPTSSWDRDWHSTRSRNAIIGGIENFFSIFGLAAPDENDLVKRVIAVGGQTVQCCDAQGNIEIDGKRANEHYGHYTFPYQPGLPFAVKTADGLSVNPAGREFGPVRIPEGFIWAMGDNRNESLDSRGHIDDQYSGAVPISNIRGKAVFRIWPPNRIGPIH
ncbi:signal peptidase I [Nocardia sp. NPDC051570]|uniref:signal peptidase I n=1 Tax=Nocardia sp. NPDC051570 TaxID=3364324 RepID=UPI0037AFE27C